MLVRYDTEDENGETRRQRNARFGQPPGPEADVPAQAEHVWGWFWMLNSGRHWTEGGPQALSYSEIAAWSRLTATLIRPEELQMLVAMDGAYRVETAKEMKARREAEADDRHSKARLRGR